MSAHCLSGSPCCSSIFMDNLSFALIDFKIVFASDVCDLYQSN